MSDASEQTRAVKFRRSVPDLFGAVALFALGLVARHAALPKDGLVFDDAWVVIGASKAGVGQLLRVSTSQPGFTALLMPWHDFVSARAEWMALPAYIVGAGSASVLYLVLRRWRVAWPVSLLISVLLVVAPVAVRYSGRVKPYVFEIVLVTLLATVLPRLSRVRWTWATAALWVAASAALGAFSAFTLLPLATAGLILALHARGDRPQRWVAFVVQGVASLMFLLYVRSIFDSDALNRGLEEVWDGYIEVYANPLRMAGEIATHFARVGGSLLGGINPFTFAIVVAALFGLSLESRNGNRRIQARFLALPLIVFVAGLARQIPFGTTRGPEIYPGGRSILWLLPSLTIGLAFTLDAATRGIRRRFPVAVVPLSVALVVLAAGIVVVNIDNTPSYPSSGAKSAQQFVAVEAGPDDVVILLPTALWTYAAQPEVDVRVQVDESINGFQPVLTDRRIWRQDVSASWGGTIDQLRQRTSAAQRVLVINGYVGLFDKGLPQLEAALREVGFEQTGEMRTSDYAVSLWERPTP